ncbi:MAG TPA: tetratricopeptide repeat-containing sensor histidine kinase [Ignavibacteria bacterium]|nr:tetratricopeptide repeat-containing sensor histidine kinase [Ignavibacteria bacterium]
MKEIAGVKRTPEYMEKYGALVRRADEARGVNPEEFKKVADEFMDAAKKSGDVDVRIEAEYLLADYYWQKNDFKESIDLITKTKSLAFKNKRFHWVASCNNLLGINYINKGDYETAINHLVDALNFYLKVNDRRGLIGSYGNLGTAYYFLDDYPTALDFFIKSVNYSKDADSGNSGATALMNIGNINFRNEDYNQAIDYYTQALQKSSLDNNKIGIANCLNNIGICYKMMNQMGFAVKYLKDALDIGVEISNLKIQSVAIFNLGFIELTAQNYKVAKEYFEKGLSIAESKEDKYNMVEGYFALGSYFKDPEINDTENALIYFKKAFELAVEIKAMNILSKIEVALSEIFESKEDYKTSLEYYKRYHNTKEKMFNETSDKKLKSLQTLYKVESALKETESLRNKNAELDKLNEDLTYANNRLHKLNLDKTEFMNIAAHDLKNPLLGIKGVAELLRFDEDLAKDEFDSYLDMIIFSSGNMFQIIKNILNVNLIEEGKIDFHSEKFDVAELINKLIISYNLPASNKSININFENKLTEKILQSDRHLIYQVFDNLISNALKYSPHNSLVNVNVYNDKSSTRLVFEVEDKGPGFSEEDKTKIFGKFSKLSAQPTGGEQSSGLGLFIVNKLLNILNGDITLESEKGKGSKFIVTIPLSHN